MKCDFFLFLSFVVLASASLPNDIAAHDWVGSFICVLVILGAGALLSPWAPRE